MTERALRLGRGKGLVGVLTPPSGSADAGAPVGVILLNSGVIHRPGPNRVYVAMARQLADARFSVLRFDFSGIGDSDARTDTATFSERTLDETGRAMDALGAATGARRFVLAGICSGAIAAVSSGARDARVMGVVAINHAAHRGGGGQDFGRTMVRHYRRLAWSSSFRRKAWANVARGAINHRRLGETARMLLRQGVGGSDAAAAASNGFLTNMQELITRRVHTLLVHSEGDEGLDFTHLALGRALAEQSASGLLALKVILGANHTFTLVNHQRELVSAVTTWTEGLPRTIGSSHE